MNELAIKKSSEVADFELMQRQAKVMLESGLFSDTKSLAAAVVKVMAGRELGLGPFESMRDINVIQGKTTLAASQVAARIKRSGKYDYRIVEKTDTKCVLRFSQGDEVLTPDVTFTLEDARKLGLAGKDNYNKQPATMLFWRALTMGARMFCADVFGGSIYVPEELQATEKKERPAPVLELEQRLKAAPRAKEEPVPVDVDWSEVEKEAELKLAELNADAE